MPFMTKLTYILSFAMVTIFLSPRLCLGFGDTTKMRNDELRQVVDAIASYNKVEDRAIGESAKPSEQYKRFEILYNRCTDNQLLFLINHRNSVVKAYVFWALSKRQYSDIQVLADKIKNGKKLIRVQFGCRLFDITLKEFIADRINSERKSDIIEEEM